MKAVASTKFNKSGLGGAFFWQEEYGAFSFDGKRLANFVDYVGRQKEHHTRGTVIPILERTSGEGVVRVGESPAGFVLNDASWRAELASLPLFEPETRELKPD